MKYILILVSLGFIFYYQYRKKNFNDPLISKIKNDIEKVDPRIKNLNFHGSNVSETINKKNVYLCIKDSNNNYYDYNMLIYVALHECAHAISKAIDEDHSNTSQEFKDNFKMLLDKAEIAGIYNPNIPKVEKYCGVS